MSDIDTKNNTTSEPQRCYIPKKKNVAFEAIKGFTSFVGAYIVLSAAISSISNSWKAKTLKSYDAEYIAKMLKEGWGWFFPISAAAESAAEATEHNKQVDELTKQKAESHTQRLEQEKLAAPKGPSHMR